MTRTKQRIYSAILSLSLLFLSGESVDAEPMRVVKNLRQETILLPASAPDKDRLVLVAFATMASEAEIMGALAVYDDPQTKRPVDYLELYDDSGGLLVVRWVDRFGILRTAVDRGLLQQEASQLEGVLVLLAEGTPS